MNNRTILFALAGLAVGTGAAMLLAPRNRRNAIASDARLALGYASEHLPSRVRDYLPAAARPARRKARSAGKRKVARKGRKLARAA